MKASAETRKAVLGVAQKVIDCYKRKDLDGVMSLFVPGSECVAFGAGPDEVCLGEEQLRSLVKRDFAQLDSLNMEFGDYQVGEAGSAAWFAGQGTGTATVKGQAQTLPLRYSLVLDKRDGEWRIVLSHLSAISTDRKEGRAFPA